MEQESTAKSAVNGFIAGCVGGIAGIVVGQPFDTIKVRLQTHSANYNGPLHCAKHTVQREGVRGLFKGLVSPLVGSVPINAIVFGVYGSALQAIDARPQPALSSIFYAGSFAGFLQSFIVCPSDLIKCQLQAQDGFSKNEKTFKGPIDCAKFIFRQKGIRGLAQGLGPTLLRDSYSYGVYFYVYDGVQRLLKSDSTPAQLFAGGCAGVVSWSIIYPIDVVKSVIQTLPTTSSKSEQQFFYQAKKLASEHGWRIFTKGLGTTILRAFPVNAVTFYFYELTLKELDN